MKVQRKRSSCGLSIDGVKTMGMSTHVIGFRPADEQWRKMKAVWDGCEAAGVEVPFEVDRFFQGEAPGDKPGMEVDIKIALQQWDDGNYRSGFELDVTKLPEGVRFIRFYNAC
jgi:hypothetical protein